MFEIALPKHHQVLIQNFISFQSHTKSFVIYENT